MTETPFFFPNGSYDLFGVLHDRAERTGKPGFVFCSPFAEEKLWSHRVFVSLARDLAERGYPVLRFDYMGTCDSDGEFEDSTLETRLSDIGAAVALLKERSAVESVGLLGLGLGATLAAARAEADPDISRLVLWQPVLKGPAYMKDILRINLTTQLAVYKKVRYNREALVGMLAEGKTVNIEGYELSRALYEQMSAIDMLDGPKRFGGRTLLIQIARQAGRVSRPMAELQGLYADCEAAAAQEQPFWKEIRSYYERAENLRRLTLEWLESE